MDPIINLYGMRIKLSGDLDEARRRVHLANQLRFKTQMINVNSLDIVQNFARLDDGTQVRYVGQHGLDWAEIYVPPKPTVQVPGKRRWTEQFVWPAIEAYAGTGWRDEFLGVVLCKGGGFDPPYEFIPKDLMHEDFPLYDSPDESAGPQPEVRCWIGTPTEPRMVERLFEDLEPLGVAEPDLTTPTEPDIGFDFNVEYTEAVAGCYIDDAGRYRAGGSNRFDATRTERKIYSSCWSYLLADDASPGRWPAYRWEDRDYYGARKPGRRLNYEDDYYYNETGGGSAVLYDEPHASIVSLTKPCAELKPIVKARAAYNWENRIEGVTEESWWQFFSQFTYQTSPIGQKRLVMRSCATPIEVSSEGYHCSTDYTWTVDYKAAWDYSGSVYNESSFALLVGDMNSLQITHYTLYSDTGDFEYKEGPIKVVIDGHEIVVFPEVGLNRLQFSWGTKYFQVGNKSIGLFYFGRNYYHPLDYQYVYAEVNRETGESEAIVTPFGTEDSGPIPDVTDYDGNPVYHQGFNKYRLIRETKVIKEQ